MKCHYNVIIQPTAEVDIESVYLYIAQESPKNALNWFFQIQSEISTLKRLPFRCPLAPENSVFDKEIRQLIIGKYRVLFTVELNHVHILHVRHGAQLWLFPKPE
jgi:plasmid stabilization system protein ParE